MHWLLFDTAIGQCGLAWSDVGLTWFQLPEGDADATSARLLARTRVDGATTVPTGVDDAPSFVRDAVARVQAHLGGTLTDLRGVPIDLDGVPAFNAQVLRAAQEIPAGSTATYGELAARVGSPGAARAVGRAMATNPFPIVVPCHRVVAASGATGGGFSAYGGLVTKEKLLQIEGTSLHRQTSLF